MTKYIAILSAMALGGYRLTLDPTGPLHVEDIFKDAAHLFVGGCIGAGIKGSKAGWWLAGLLTALEVGAFFVGKNTGHSVLGLFQ